MSSLTDAWSLFVLKLSRHRLVAKQAYAERLLDSNKLSTITLADTDMLFPCSQRV